MRSIPVILCIFFSIALRTGVVAENSTKKYRLIATRNIFSNTRTAPKKADPIIRHIQPPPPPPERIRLSGIILINGRAHAVLQGSLPALSGTLEVGGEIAGLRFNELTTRYAQVTTGASEIRWPVDMTLTRQPGEPWQLSEESIVNTAIEEVTPSPEKPQDPNQSVSPGGDRAEILKRLMERRKQETNK